MFAPDLVRPITPAFCGPPSPFAEQPLARRMAGNNGKNAKRVPNYIMYVLEVYISSRNIH